MSVQRDRLTALLGEQALTSIELVIAPPGYGKTTVLRDYAAVDPGAVFVALPEAAGLETFVRGVIEAAVPAAVRSVGAVFDGRSGTELEEQAATWLASRLRAFNGTIVIDDFHRTVADERVTRVLIAAIGATHGRMRWIVASREAPRFPMGSWIARGWMGLPVSGDDLRFTAGEAGDLAASLGISADDETIAAIVRDTLGWPIGVRLALGLVARGREAGATRMQTRDALFALIDDEVWQPLGPALQSVIAAAALMPAPAISTLAAAGFDTALAAMTAIFARVPFVQALDDDAFVIHDLFREFVAARTPAGVVPADATRIGGALVAGGNAADGLQLLISAGNAEDVERALAVHAFDLLERGYRAVVLHAIAFLGERGRGDDGVSLAVRGVLALADGSGSTSANFFVRALERGLPAHLRSDVARRLGMNYYNRGMPGEAIAAVQTLADDDGLTGDDRLENRAALAMFAAASGTVSADATRAELESIEGIIASASPPAQARILQRLGLAAYSHGDLETAERFLHDSALLAASLGLDTIAARAYLNLYSIAGNADTDTQRAHTFLRSLSAAAERAADTSLRVYALRAEYALAAVDGKRSAAEAIEASLGELVDARTYRDEFGYRFTRALLYVSADKVSKAESTLQSVRTSALTRSERACYDAFRLLLHLLTGQRSLVEAGLSRGLLAEVPDTYWSAVDIARAFAFRGLAFWMLGRQAQARKSFEFDVAGLPPRERVLIAAIKATTAHHYPLASMDMISGTMRTLEEANLGAFATLLRRLTERDANDVELSPAEIEILRMFDRYGGRASDVAKALGKSKYTIQNQVQSAIRKLGCSGRAEALAFARKRGWLDRTTS